MDMIQAFCSRSALVVNSRLVSSNYCTVHALFCSCNGDNYNRSLFLARLTEYNFKNQRDSQGPFTFVLDIFHTHIHTHGNDPTQTEIELRVIKHQALR